MFSNLVHDPNNVQIFIKINYHTFKNWLELFSGKTKKNAINKFKMIWLGQNKPPTKYPNCVSKQVFWKIFFNYFDIGGGAVYMIKCILCPPNLPKNVSSIDNCVLYLETRVWSKWKIGVKNFLEFSDSDYLVRTQKKMYLYVLK